MHLLAIVLVATGPAASSGTSALTTLYYIGSVIGVLFLLVGAAGFGGLFRSIKKMGVRDSQVDRVIKEVLGDRTPEGKEIPSLRTELMTIKTQMSPNGGKSMADRVARTDAGVQELRGSVGELRGELQQTREQLAQHIGSSNAEHQTFRNAIKDLQNHAK